MILTACLLALLPAAGCTQGSRPDDDSGTAKGVAPGSVTVVDFLGRQVAVPDRVERIGCLYAFSGHVVTMLGRGNDIVAVVEGLKRDALMRELCPRIDDALVPASGGAVNVEELLNARPDLVFIRSETAANEGEAAKLQKTGIPYLVVDYRNMKEQMDIVEMIGQAVGKKEKARQYNEYYQRCIDRVQERVKDIPPDKRVRVYHSINEATRTDARDTLPADWTQAAGVINVSVNEQLRFLEDKYFAGLEQILLWDPEVILVNEVGVVDYIMTNPQWSALSAVKNNKVYQMPVGISRWGHPGSLETPLAILWTAKTLYPDLFTDIDLVAETKYFYGEIFNYPLTGQMVDRVLKGQGMRAPKGKAD